MGLISWIRDKYYERKYHEAEALLHNGQYESSVKILKKIQEVCPLATKLLLENYHSQIMNGNADAICSVADLFKKHKDLKDLCVDFCKEVGEQNKKIAMDYSLALYQEGLTEMSSFFEENARVYLLQSENSIPIDTLTTDQNLIKELAETLYEDLKGQYERGEFNDAIRLSDSLWSYYKSREEFLKLYYNIRWNDFAKQPITAESITNLDNILVGIRKEMPVEYISFIESNIYDLSRSSYKSGEYVAALLLSNRVWEKSAEAQAIYKDSAYFLYEKNKNAERSLIDRPSLYKMFGEGMSYINELERFVRFDSEFEDNYVKAVALQLIKYAEEGNSTDALYLLVRACSVKFSPSFFSSTIGKGPEKFRETIVTSIINNYGDLLSSRVSILSFVDNLMGLSDKKFVLNTLENLLKAGHEIKEQYTDYNISCLNKKGPKRQLEILNHALCWVENETLLSAKFKACEAYTKAKPLGDDFIVSQCGDLVDKHPDAQILLTTIAINRASDGKLGVEERDVAIRKAISFKSSHSSLFSLEKYEKELPNIGKVANLVAKELFALKSLEEAVSLLYYLRDNNLEWYETYVDIYTSINYNSREDAISTLKSIVDEGRDTGSVALKQLWRKLLSLIKSVHKSDADSCKLAIYTWVFDSLSACAAFDGKDYLISIVVDTIDQIHFSLGKAFEQAEDYENAVHEYELITDGFKQKDSSICRIMICELKKGKRLPKNKIEEMKEHLCFNMCFNISDDVHKELAFRLSLSLAQKGCVEDARSINDQYLNDTEIEAFCCDQNIKKKEIELKKLNEQFLSLTQGELSASDALLLGQSLSKKLQSISSIVTLSKQTEDDLKESIRLYAIEQFYNEGDYVNCQKGLKVQDSSYLSDPINLRNIATMCLCATENGQLTASLYKEFLALWATAIYQQEIFIKSLDYTSWDDPHTFTLKYALGVLHDSSKLPENVGYADEMEDNVVSVRDIQKALIVRMQVALDAYPTEYQRFFDEQIDAMEKLSHVELFPPCVIVAPYLLQLSSQYKQAVTYSLEVGERAHNDNWEEILHTGNLYDITTGHFGDYQTACQYLECAVDSLRSRKNERVAFANSRVDTIRGFDGLFSSLVASATSALNKSIAEDDDYNNVTRNFYQLCKILQDESFSLVFSNYINQKVVGVINGSDISLGEGAEALYKVYEIYTSNNRLNHNLKNLVSSLVLDYLTKHNTGSLNALDNILSSTRDFDKSVVETLSGGGQVPEDAFVLDLILPNEKAFTSLSGKIGGKSKILQTKFNTIRTKLEEAKIIDQLNKIVGSLKMGNWQVNALTQVYNLYANNKNNVIICSTLASLIPRYVVDYVAGDKQGSQSVRKVLDKLKTNMSATFINNNSAISDAYNEIWSRLSLMNRRALEMGSGLTANGIALKTALTYLKDLS